ncbi:hydrogenase expression/formation protein HypE [Sphaerisporangium melleum]|uniref:Hydrogenase expression/formation protein HypE n=1 Tax=Sphaerisporangium melleum TaxID=321316 RepID=A0A917QXV6_9ACTN|nr:hydrogenase expression/formation protein HypE [Sphaerisporangium melleum]GGK76010.1 hydrogenase expression/formation protein HypE [Sphaerisporangium melleum]GII72699.1 hydrogenase expression/formation protein HypE [Sphaerisporangium melleum]
MNREELVLERIERARRSRPRLREELVTLAHGAGGKASRTLVEAVFLPSFRNPHLEPLADGAVLDLHPGTAPPDGEAPDGGAQNGGGLDGEAAHGRAPDGVSLDVGEPVGGGAGGPATTGGLAFTTDSYVVTPLFFPGGDIGDLAVNGTVNDLAMCGARPAHLSAAFIIEEGFPVEHLRRIATTMAGAARAAGVTIVTGDTKVVQRGKADGCYITTAGVGMVPSGVRLGADAVRPGDAVIVSGPIGEHGVTVMLARGRLDIEAELVSDTAPLNGLTARLLEACPDGRVRCLRDATRGGVATVLNEIARSSEVAVIITEEAVPVRPVVRGACELLGIDPLYVACEGRMVAVVAGESADAALAALRSHPLGEEAAVVGRVAEDPPGLVLLKTGFGGTRIVDVLVGDPLPRIC